LYKISDVIEYLLKWGLVGKATAQEALEHIRARRFN
jgi:hypothetical protein